MKKLELKHIAPYLPFSLKVIMEGKICNVAWMSTKNIAVHRPGGIGDYKKIRWKYAHLNVKPILRPLLDITKEIEHNGEKFIPMQIIMEIWDEVLFDESSYVEEWYEIVNNVRRLNVWKSNVLFSKLAEWHFDYFGMFGSSESLIEKGLAIDINTLKQ